MLREAMQYIAGLKEESMDPKVVEINGKTYCNKNLTRYGEEPMASAIEATTLTAMIDYIKNCKDELRESMVIHVVNPTTVKLYSGLTKERDREHLFKSNAIVLVKDNMTIGVGAGQMNRVGAAKIAIEQAGEKAKGSIMSSDAFFPMPDTVEEAVKAGVTAIIQPGGSIKDQLSIDVCNEHGIAMVYTGVRHFKH